MIDLQDAREQDVLRLCDKILDVNPTFRYNSNGPDTSSYPFCHEYVNGEYGLMNEIKHKQDCAYLLAKDLSTGL